ncbi:MAG: helix-turn-helix transcriptional regulator [Gammaproteobacteria bacterium]|jgi:excisionase family DNA binding protein|nr:helix-turn-helix transcriptional regulator [Gammaproteobacteria bacterium]MBT3724264.1 helix-turn-helix transcriptional regulator [Gammaproteobacteria bacterium]MBT4076540.1 helix-turn-helix transcriptional regulator [Gammaproteobacteria bacterium]MBT4193488.1 helix-turn-helix transcriptional regulator [Gammaproteobacteria bacterium]MBT4449210.1 helix-turn-helix transcriptional regulator [Gammaproteobacteria bacterium]
MNRLLENQIDVFMSVRQVSNYLHVNEKKIYALVNEGHIPATKITGKWMFPKELIDKWMLDSTHNGLLHDRLIITGSDDPLLYRIVLEFAETLGNKALITYTSTGTRPGLDLLNANKVDACCIHWGPESESNRRHPSLIQQYSKHHNWVLIRAFKREQGLIFKSSNLDTTPIIPELFNPSYRWSIRQKGSGAQRFLMEILSKYGLNQDGLNSTTTSLSEREAASSIILKKSDISVGTRAIANEFGLDFISLGWQAFDFVIPRNIWFRHLFQNLIASLKSDFGQEVAFNLGGYKLNQCGDLIWGED